MKRRNGKGAIFLVAIGMLFYGIVSLNAAEGHDHHHKMGEMDAPMEMMMDHSGDDANRNRDQRGASAVKEVRIEAYQFGFSPESVRIKKGELVKLVGTSRDVAHGIFIKEFGVNLRVEKGRENTVEFVADKTGTFKILCSVYCGAGHHKMKADLVVEP